METEKADGTLSILVKDVEGQPLTGAIVEVHSSDHEVHMELETNDQGQVNSKTLSHGLYMIIVSMPGFDTESRQVVIDPNEELNLTFEMVFEMEDI